MSLQPVQLVQAGPTGPTNTVTGLAGQARLQDTAGLFVSMGQPDVAGSQDQTLLAGLSTDQKMFHSPTVSGVQPIPNSGIVSYHGHSITGPAGFTANLCGSRDSKHACEL